MGEKTTWHPIDCVPDLDSDTEVRGYWINQRMFSHDMLAREARELQAKSVGDTLLVTTDMLAGSPMHTRSVQDALERLEKCLWSGRKYLMGVHPDRITVEDALVAFGYGPDGRRMIPEAPND